MLENILQSIMQRINELKYQKVHLRPFIASDAALGHELDRAIAELEWVYALIDKSNS